MSNTTAIDADGHILERRDELRQYLEAPYDKRGGGLTPSDPWDRSLYGTLPHNQEEYPRVPGAEDWLRLMDESEISAAYLYPTSTGNVSRVREVDFAVALCTAYNNYVYDKFAKVSDRLKPVALISPQDPASAARELRRAVEKLGYRAGVIRTTGLRLPLGHRFYDPIYEEADRLGCAIAVHGTNGGEEVASGNFDSFIEVHTVSFPVGIMAQFTSMIYQGVPERFPNLRLAFLEIGCTWLPYWLDRMDEHWEKRGEVETPHLNRRPSDCVRDREIYFSLEAEETLLPETIRHVGDGHFLYATDIPHWDNEYRESLQRLRDREDLPAETRRKILRDNAAALYR